MLRDARMAGLAKLVFSHQNTRGSASISGLRRGMDLRRFRSGRVLMAGGLLFESHG